MNRSNQSVSLLVVLLVSMMVRNDDCQAENWPRFRGANGSGVAPASDLPNTWTEANYRWVAPLSGSGHSSPVIWGERLFVTAADEKSGIRALICLGVNDGVEQWRAPADFKSYKKHKNNSFASSTPAVDAEHVYQLWHSKQQTSLIAYSHEGQQVWRYELGPYGHGQGGATSPVVVGELVLVAHDHKAESFLVAVNRNSGKEVWKIPREGKRACYSTPCYRTTKSGKQEIVFVHCYEGVIGVQAETGQVNWHIDPFGRESQRALASPVVAEDLVIAGSGAVAGDRQMVAISVDDSQLPSKTSESYRLIRQAPHVPSPIILGDRLFLWNDGGVATCCDLTTGEKIWQKRVGGNYFSSPIAIGDRLMSIDTSGEVVVIAAKDEFEILGRNAMGESSRASLAASNGVLFVRTETKVFAVTALEEN
ncbi:MAG: PQQ-binding-like beta-propeller repeat protein [Rubripirellula sp.]|nr:PQQ-binding-like beta-propeller repeat protein [Rubripirellula sp.]